MFDIENLKITQFPIVIYASPRTGCSVVADIISNKYPKLKYFNEPFAPQNNSIDFINHAKNDNLYIIKTMSYDMFEKKYLIDFRIKLLMIFKIKHLILEFVDTIY